MGGRRGRNRRLRVANREAAAGFWAERETRAKRVVPEPLRYSGLRDCTGGRGGYHYDVAWVKRPDRAIA